MPPQRKSIRLRGYDYTQAGAYFVTICAQGHACLFGNITNGEMRLNNIGNIVAEEWAKTREIRIGMELDAWVVMPNHFHGIIVIVDSRRRGDRPVAPTGPQPRSVGAVVAGFKSAATKRINALRGTPGTPVWQRNYHEHIIRNEGSLDRIRQYILDNPAQWATDRENPSSHSA
ncbi:transposase [Pseudoluteimonas lycopersici]|uniref:Transposase n=1 Tax=Pseudoluteimonas lycopersici TaxID=1324796 RepID=A0A516V5Z7_9GAMM|nr:transposase [Lysobacter lycopersici]QDQ73921.1 transposase [Lysobacter lycopersici]